MQRSNLIAVRTTAATSGYFCAYYLTNSQPNLTAQVSGSGNAPEDSLLVPEQHLRSFLLFKTNRQMRTSQSTAVQEGAVGANVNLAIGQDLQHGALTTIDIEGKRRYALIFDECCNAEYMEWYRDALIDVLQNLSTSDDVLHDVSSTSVYYALDLVKFFNTIPS